jgi:hypothetical protein
MPIASKTPSKAFRWRTIGYSTMPHDSRVQRRDNREDAPFARRVAAPGQRPLRRAPSGPAPLLRREGLTSSLLLRGLPRLRGHWPSVASAGLRHAALPDASSLPPRDFRATPKVECSMAQRLSINVVCLVNQSQTAQTVVVLALLWREALWRSGRHESPDRARRLRGTASSRSWRPAAHSCPRSAVRPPEPGFATQQRQHNCCSE